MMLPATTQASKDTPDRRSREASKDTRAGKKKKRRGEGKRRRDSERGAERKREGIKVGTAPMSLERTAAAAASWRSACFSSLRTTSGMPKWRPAQAPSKRQVLTYVWRKPPTLAASCFGPGRKDVDKPLLSKATQKTLFGYTLGWHEASHTRDNLYGVGLRLATCRPK